MVAVKFLDILEKLPDGDIIKAVAWKVTITQDFTEGIKYGFAYIHKGKRILGYDNERAKGHHKHIVNIQTGAEVEVEIDFQDVLSLFRQFKKEAYELREKLYGEKYES